MPFPAWLPRSTKKEETVYSSIEVDASRSDTDVSNQTETFTVARWPAGPQHVANASLWLIADLLLLLMPVAFVALAVLAYKLDGKELSDRGHKIQEATLLGPTLFPLAFAALGGRSLKKIALWRAQEGTSLGFLEHLIGSQSLVATLGHAIALHSLNLLTLGLLVLWVLSPLGGQSALRLMHETNTTVIDTRPVFYANVDASSSLPIGGNNVDSFNRVNSVVSTSLMTADTLEWSPVDTWNHPKIPRVEELEKAEDRNETNRMWYNLDRHANHSYAALTGVNVVNLFQSGATNFTIPYEYMYFGCELSPANNMTTRPVEGYGYNETFPNYLTQLKYLRDLDAEHYLDSAGQFPPKYNYSIAPAMSSTSVTQRDFFFYTKIQTMGTGFHKPEALLYGSTGNSKLTYYLFECSMKSVMVEANIICEAASCRADRLRRLSIPRSERNGSYLPYDIVTEGMSTRYFIQYLAHIGGDNGISQDNPVDSYIYGETPWGELSRKNWTEYIHAPQRTVDMSHRLTRLLNTYWDASRWPIAMTRNDPWGKTSINQTSGEPFYGMSMNRADATAMRQVPIYHANAGWVACLVICSCVLLLLGIFGFFLSLRITVPDIFDYVSSFTRDNPYINAPRGGSGLNGAERARLLRKLPVQLGDTDAGGEFGYITMRSINSAKDREQGRVKRGRMYR